MAKEILPEDRFGKWKVLGKGKAVGKHRLVKVQCECGTVKEIQRWSLLNGRSTSCGCDFSAKIAKANTKHGMTGTPIYESWRSMKQRCDNKADAMFYLYGAKGVTYCDSWGDFEQFYADMGERPEGTSLDRIDGSKGYSPENCRWATPREQALNRKTTKYAEIEFKGEIYPLSVWAEKVKIKPSVLHARIVRMGWPIERALTQPVKRHK